MDDIEAKVKKVLVQVLDNGLTVDDVHRDSDLVDEYGLDSLQAISFLLGIEDAFGISLDYGRLDLDDLTSVGRFCDYVETMLVGTP
ncbi:acyl carrier protein [Catenuloplanes indicus]|uniref:Acyl carrier protein n=1 Tax=Catenuloplanes indicus TaxID=137267 RepID=A0AAE3VWB9_9ACTN|nr:acyl carrier protein [Catenuloplanes indicus]MDQ0364929.1 acyl carrier protein [Catenuloplanes indicus]